MSQIDRFRSRRLEACRICGSSQLFTYLDLGEQPPSNSFLTAADIPNERRFPLQVCLCESCGLSQLTSIVSAEDIFDDYLYLSSTSKALCKHYQGMVDTALSWLKPKDGALIVDIGCNDGITLRCFPRDRFRLLGIEPSSAGDYARHAGLDVVCEFFNAALAEKLVRERGPASLITATNVFAHVDDIRGFAQGVRSFLAADGVYIIEFPYLVDMVERCYFDTIYHEHLSYLALTPLTRLFADTGLQAFRVERTEIGASGPALRLFVGRTDGPFAIEPSITTMLENERRWGVVERTPYRNFASRVTGVQRAIRRIIDDLRRDGMRVGAYGAPAKGNTLLNCLGLTSAEIVAVAENSPLKVGKLTPGTHIPIIDDAAFLAADITHALLLTWNYLDFFLANSEFVKRGGKFIVPIPEPGIQP